MAKAEWIQNASYQRVSDKAKLTRKEDAYLKFYDETKPLYLETDTSGVGLGAGLQQTREGMSCPRDEPPGNSILRPITFASKSLSTTERYTATQKEKCQPYYMICQRGKYNHRP